MTELDTKIINNLINEVNDYANDYHWKIIKEINDNDLILFIRNKPSRFAKLVKHWSINQAMIFILAYDWKVLFAKKLDEIYDLAQKDDEFNAYNNFLDFNQFKEIFQPVYILIRSIFNLND